MYKINGKEYPCCASVIMGLIGGKWKTVILFHLIEKPLRYNELRKKMPTVYCYRTNIKFAVKGFGGR